MTTFWKNNSPKLAPLFLLIPFALYLTTLARFPVLGDPTEYSYVAHHLGIAHPPGYAFYTLLGHLFQRLVPWGNVAQQMHLLSAVMGLLAGTAVFGLVRQLTQSTASALFAALLILTSANHWQHSIHANPHIITALFLVLNCYLLIRWHGRNDTRLLLLFSLLTGFGAAHHPLTIFSFPAFTIYILWQRPHIWREGRTLLAMVICAALGLSLFLYFPIRSPQLGDFWPQTMNTWDGFTAHVLARGLSDSLPYYTLAEHPLRLIVFAAIVRLQFAWPIVLLALLGAGWLLKNRPTRPSSALLLIAFTTHYAFVMSLKAQDIMAYSLGLLLLIATLAGVGTAVLLRHLASRGRWLTNTAVALLFLMGPLWQTAANLPHISLAHYDEAQQHIQQVYHGFTPGDNVVLLNNWEFMTPLWYTRFANGTWPEDTAVRPKFVSAAEPWLPSVFNYLGGGPLYLNSYRREIVDAGFRLRPVPHTHFYQVIEPIGPQSLTLPDGLTSLPTQPNQPIHFLAYDLPTQTTAGDFVPFTLAMRLPITTTDFYIPVLQLGHLSYEFTTDTHLTTPLWNPNEIIIERFDFALPHHLPAGNYPVQIRWRNLTQNQFSGDALPLGQIDIRPAPFQPNTSHLLANFRQRVGLTQATVWHNASRTTAPWDANAPIRVKQGESLTLFLDWLALDHAEESYTVFVHLNTLENIPLLAPDYTPLGGAVPTHLWFPKWLPGQRLTDPYQLHIGETIPPGTYYIEVGLYEMTSGRRLHRHNAAGNLIGDRFVLGQVIVE